MENNPKADRNLFYEYLEEQCEPVSWESYRKKAKSVDKAMAEYKVAFVRVLPHARATSKTEVYIGIEQKYASAGYKLPRLVFWNVNSRTGTIPVRENDMGVALVSGFSVNICKMVMSGKTDPYECLLEALNSERYKPVEEVVKQCLKGGV